MKNIDRIRTWCCSILIGAILSIAPTMAFATMELIAIDNEAPFLSIVNRATGEELAFLFIDLPGGSAIEFGKATGLAVHPHTNEVYAAIRINSQPGAGRNLFVINQVTGVALSAVLYFCSIRQLGIC